MKSQTRASMGAALAICAAFLAFGTSFLGDFGLTADERESSLASEEAWEFATGARADFSRRHAIPGYYFALDLARAVFSRAVALALPDVDAVLVEHAFNLGIATASLALLYLLAFEIGRSVRAAAFSTACLALMPGFIGHSHNNPKDLPAVFTFLLAFWLMVRAVRLGGARRATFASLAMGLSLNTRSLSVGLVPMFALWLGARWPALAGAQWKRLAGIGLGAAFTAFALWPWVWPDPLGRIAEVRELVGETLSVHFPILYMGRIWLWTDVPWHYTPFHLLATTPLCLLMLAVLSAAGWRAWRQRRPELADLVWTGVIWVGSLLVMEQLASARYDGIRHYLMILVGVSILAGSGAEWLLQSVERAIARAGHGSMASRVAWGLVAFLGLSVAWELARVHPYESAYLNPAAVALAGPRTDRWLEVAHWGDTLKEGSEWLEIHAEPDALVHAPVFAHIARHYLGARVMPSAAEFMDASRPRYLMLVTRRAWYDPVTRSMEARRQPVYAIRRQRSTLLEIYRNEAPLAR